jgi:hypothetical protein
MAAMTPGHNQRNDLLQIKQRRGWGNHKQWSDRTMSVLHNWIKPKMEWSPICQTNSRQISWKNIMFFIFLYAS